MENLLKTVKIKTTITNLIAASFIFIKGRYILVSPDSPSSNSMESSSVMLLVASSLVELFVGEDLPTMV